MPAHAPHPPRRPPPNLSACSLIVTTFCGVLLLCCMRREPGLKDQTLPMSWSYSHASYKSNTHLKLVSDKSSSLLRVQLDPIDGHGERPRSMSILKRMRRGVASGVPHAEVGPYA